MKLTVTSLVLVFTLAFSLPAAAEQREYPQFDGVLRNENIVMAVREGVSDQEIVTTMKTMKTEFDMSPEAVARLRAERVSGTVIEAMQSTLPPAVEHHAQHSPASNEVLTNHDVLRMVRSGLPDSVIVAAVETSPGNYDTDVDALLTLSDEGVPATVIVAMQHAVRSEERGSLPLDPPDEPVFVDSNDPADPHTFGIWLYTEVNGQPKMEMVRAARAVANQNSGGGFFGGLGRTAGAIGGGLAGGAIGAAGGAIGGTVVDQHLNEIEIKVVIPQKHAEAATADRNPEFYFYFDPATASGPSPGFGPQSQVSLFSQAAHPVDFSLVKLDDKRDSRELKVMSFNSFGQRVGIDDPIDFRVEEVRPGVYRVTPAERLDDKKEYAFVSNVMYNASPHSIYSTGYISPNIFPFSVPDF